MSGTTRIESFVEYDANMHLSSIKYSEFRGQDIEWNLETVELGRVNLLVGRNATGKSRFISIIANLSNALADRPKRPTVNGTYRRILPIKTTYMLMSLNMITLS